MDDKCQGWFTVDKIDDNSFVISEYKHWEETHCYLLNGSERSLIIDTGLGVCNISNEVRRLTDNSVTAVATHIHWDHIGGHKYFPDFYAHKNELSWLTGEIPLSVDAIKAMIVDRCNLPDNYDVNTYELFQGGPTRVLSDRDIIDLGDRQIAVIHTPGHSPGSISLFEKEKGYLFVGDLVYKGTLLANFPSTDPGQYLQSLEKLAVLKVKRIFPGHHTLDIDPEILLQMRDEFRKLKISGQLCHGSGTFDYGDWAICL